jgi:hypothetical protein
MTLLLPAAPALAKPARLRVVGTPALYPHFRRNVPDYVARCVPGEKLTLSIRAPKGTTVAVDRRRPRRGSFEAAVPVSSGQSFRLVATSHRRHRRYFVRCLPPDFPEWTSEAPGRPQAAWYVVAPCCSTSTYVAIFDTHGVPVWWINTGFAPLDASLLPDGGVVWAQQHGTELDPGISSGTYEEHSLNGVLRRTFSIPGGIPTDRHEMQLLPNGDYVVVAYRPRDGVDLSPYGGPSDATVLDGAIYEVTPGGRIAWSWRSSDHIDLAETGRWYRRKLIKNPVRVNGGKPAYDIVHINAVDPYGPHRFVVSMRHLDAVYAIDKPTGNVLWKIGGTHTSRSLSIRGRKVNTLGGPHDVRALPDGTITVHDNGTGRGHGPRALRFRVRAKRRTARVLERITNPAATESTCCGSARRLPGGHWAISWGGINLIEEMTAASKRVFALHFAAHMSYRAFPVMPGRLSRSALRTGMNAMHHRSRPR